MKTLNEQFVSFCENKPAGETYNYCDANICACAQFAEHMGIKEQYSASVSYGSKFYRMEVLALMQPHNFGALADRARSLL